jgi:hypothetical protein
MRTSYSSYLPDPVVSSRLDKNCTIFVFGRKPLPDPEDLKNFQKLFSGFMSFLKILEIVLGLPKKLSGSGYIQKFVLLR